MRRTGKLVARCACEASCNAHLPIGDALCACGAPCIACSATPDDAFVPSDPLQPEAWTAKHGRLSKWPPRVWAAFCDTYWDADTRLDLGVATDVDVDGMVALRAKLWTDSQYNFMVEHNMEADFDLDEVYAECERVCRNNININIPAMTKYTAFNGEALVAHKAELSQGLQSVVEKLDQPRQGIMCAAIGCILSLWSPPKLVTELTCVLMYRIVALLYL